jgi:hypothetical protein
VDAMKVEARKTKASLEKQVETRTQKKKRMAEQQEIEHRPVDTSCTMSIKNYSTLTQARNLYQRSNTQLT